MIYTVCNKFLTFNKLRLVFQNVTVTSQSMSFHLFMQLMTVLIYLDGTQITQIVPCFFQIPGGRESVLPLPLHLWENDTDKGPNGGA